MTFSYMHQMTGKLMPLLPPTTAIGHHFHRRDPSDQWIRNSLVLPVGVVTGGQTWLQCASRRDGA